MPRKKSDFDSPVLGVLVEALRLANSRHDRVVLRRICREWEQLTGVVLEPHAVGAAAVLVGGDFLRAWVDVAGSAGRESGNALERIRADLVDRLNFPEVVDRFLEEGWRSWGVGEPAETSAYMLTSVVSRSSSAGTRSRPCGHGSCQLRLTC